MLLLLPPCCLLLLLLLARRLLRSLLLPPAGPPLAGGVACDGHRGEDHASNLWAARGMQHQQLEEAQLVQAADAGGVPQADDSSSPKGGKTTQISSHYHSKRSLHPRKR